MAGDASPQPALACSRPPQRALPAGCDAAVLPAVPATPARLRPGCDHPHGRLGGPGPGAALRPAQGSNGTIISAIKKSRNTRHGLGRRRCRAIPVTARNLRALVIALAVLVLLGTVADSRLPHGAPASKRSRAPGRQGTAPAAGRQADPRGADAARGHTARAVRSDRGISREGRIAACQHRPGRASAPVTPGPASRKRRRQYAPAIERRRPPGCLLSRQLPLRPGHLDTLPPLTVYSNTAKYPAADAPAGRPMTAGKLLTPCARLRPGTQASRFGVARFLRYR